jgi:uncharacterized protein (DUF697 family)
MTKIPGPKGFWEIIKSINVSEVQRAAARHLRIALVGSEESRAAALASLAVDGDAKRIGTANESSLQAEIHQYDNISAESGFPQEPGFFDIILDLDRSRTEPVASGRVYTVTEIGGWDNVVPRILDDQPALSISLARTFPAFRNEAAARIIAQTSAVNAQFALLTGVAEQVPILGQIGLPVAAFSDMIMLTKNQVMMTLKLAAIYGLDTDLKARGKDLLPIQGNAFGWRAVARELVGIVPVIGFLPRAMIAYAGTQAVGRAMQFFYLTGEHVTGRHLRQLYLEAYTGSRGVVKQLAATVQKAKRQPKPVAATGKEKVVLVSSTTLPADSQHDEEKLLLPPAELPEVQASHDTGAVADTAPI